VISTYQLRLAVARYVRGVTHTTREIELAWRRLGPQLRRELASQHPELDADGGQFVQTHVDHALAAFLQALRPMREAAQTRTDAVDDTASAVRAARMTAVNAAHRALAEATRAKHVSLGIERYTWISSRDQRVRRRHRELDKTVHRWDDPPVSNPDTGRRAHPGEDYGCRCTASPVIEDIEAAIERRSAVASAGAPAAARSGGGIWSAVAWWLRGSRLRK
jgi:SPP1 gp7 family putative phage head morphogenesis protein